jgi:hypothetical protein
MSNIQSTVLRCTCNNSRGDLTLWAAQYINTSGDLPGLNHRVACTKALLRRRGHAQHIPVDLELEHGRVAPDTAVWTRGG